MYNIAKASEQDRRVLFRNTAQQTAHVSSLFSVRPRRQVS